MPPPPRSPAAVLPLIVEFLTIRFVAADVLHRLAMPPPPLPAALLLTVTFVRVSVLPSLLAIAPPLLTVLPCVAVRFEMLTVLFVLILNTRLASLPLTTMASLSAPVFGPVIVMFLLIGISPD